MKSGIFKHLSRRSFLQWGGASSLLLTAACGRKSGDNDESRRPPLKRKSAVDLTRSTNLSPGYLSVIQGPTSATETLINIFIPRLKSYTFEVQSESGEILQPELYDLVKGPVFFNVQKLRVRGLQVGQRYFLRVRDRKVVVDERIFRALDVSKRKPRWALLSCMSDDVRFEEVIDPIWNRLQEQRPDMILMCGDIVYVDAKDFVERKNASEFDLWQRYVDSLKRIPLYHWRELTPIFAVWDDHDYGTNDGDSSFIMKNEAIRLFRALFQGPRLEGCWEPCPEGLSSVLTAFGQRFFLMDDRTFRQPIKGPRPADPHAHWGQIPQEWLLSTLRTSAEPAWIVNGSQFYNFSEIEFKESYQGDHPAAFAAVINELRQIQAPVVFGSGDVHFSEIVKVPLEQLGYETYEFTSSSMHSFAGEGWDNPRRIEGAFNPEHNFLFFESEAASGRLAVEVASYGVEDSPVFVQNLVVQR